MKYAVFYRNLNLGRANCPTKLQLEQAFLDAGATLAASFLTNGTLVFEAPTTRARKLLAQANQRLQASCGLKEPAFLRSLAQLNELVAQEPFASIDPASVYERCITFLSAEATEWPATPLRSKRGDVEVLRFTAHDALSLSHQVGNTAGSPNAFLEKLLGAPATTRAWNTVVRLVQKHA